MKGIEVRNLSKSYADIKALCGVSVTFKEGRLYGLLGRNGAGKTTLLNSITGRIFADEGEIFVDGEQAVENDRAQGKIFMMGEKNLYPDAMKVKDAVKWTEEFYPDFDKEYFIELSEKFGLKVNKKIKSLSTGYGSIFKLVLALSSNASYLFFDEPVLGLDANHRDMFYKALLTKFSERPFTAVISTHLIEEVAGIIEEVVIIKDGEIIKNQDTESLLRKGCTLSGSAAAVEDYIRDKNVLGVDSLGGLRSAYLIEDIDPGSLPPGVEMGKMDLQKLFIYLTNE
jgi:ABC-2 type transport system ATP-binding protein